MIEVLTEYKQNILRTALEQTQNTSELPGYPWEQVADEDVTSMSYLIKGVINKGDIVFMFGDSGTMKSFVATDMAFHVATGQKWQNHRVKQTGVLVVIAEGQAGYKKRVKAVIKKYAAKDVPIWILPEPVALDKDADVLNVWIKMAEDALGCEIGLILMDTFSLMLGDGDESNNSDVSAALNGLRKAAVDRAVLLIHHTGHGDKGRERGAYQIRGNADVRILVQRDEDGKGRVITISNLKNKDDCLFEDINLGFEVIELGTDADGDPVSSLVIVETSEEPVNARQGKANKPLDYVKASISATGSNERDIIRTHFMSIYPAKTEDAKRQAFSRGWNQWTNEICKQETDL